MGFAVGSRKGIAASAKLRCFSRPVRRCKPGAVCRLLRNTGHKIQRLLAGMLGRDGGRYRRVAGVRQNAVLKPDAVRSCRVRLPECQSWLPADNGERCQPAARATDRSRASGRNIRTSTAAGGRVGTGCDRRGAATRKNTNRSPQRAESHMPARRCAVKPMCRVGLCGKASRGVCDWRCFATFCGRNRMATQRLAPNLLNTGLVRVFPGFDPQTFYSY
jgi:hypothetical protein